MAGLARLRFSTECNRTAELRAEGLYNYLMWVSTQPCNHILVLAVLAVLVVLAVHVLAKLEVAARPLRLTCTCTRERRRPLSATMLISAGGPSAMASATLYVLNGSCTGKTAAAGALGAPRERAPSTLAPVTRAVSPTGASAA